MSTTLGDLRIPVKADMAGFQQTVTKQAGEAGTSAGTKFGESFNEAGKRLIKGFIGAELILKTVDVLKDAIAAAKEDQLATEQLSQAIRTNATARAGDAAAIEKQIAAAQKLGFTDNEVKTSLTSLVIATKDLGKAMDDQNLAFDLARARHMSLQEASQALVAVEAGRFRGLANLGIHLKANATAEEALAEIRARVAGQGATFAATDEGAAKRRDAAYDKLLETIGKKLLPIVTQLANFGTDVLIPALSGIAEVAGSLVPVIEALGVALVTKVALGFGQAALAAVGFGIASVTAAAEVGTSAAAEVTSVGLVTGAFDALKASAIAGWLATLGPAALLAGAGAAFVLLVNNMDQVNKAQLDAAKSAGDLTGAQALLKAEAESGKITWDEYDVQVSQVQSQQELLARSAVLAAGGTNKQADAAGKAAVANDQGTKSLAANTGATDDNTAATNENAKSMGASGEHALNLGDAFGYVTKGLGGVTEGARVASYGASQLQRDMKALYGVLLSDGDAAMFVARGMHAAAVEAQLAAAAVAAFKAGHPVNLNLGAGTADAQVRFNVGSVNTGAGAFDQAALDAHNQALGPNFGYVAPKRGSSGGGGGGAGGASQATKDQAATIRADLTTAYQAAKAAGDAYFDKMHANNLKAIDDTHTKKREEIASARQSVDAQLAEQKRLNAAPVSAAERAQAAIENANRARDLQEQLAAASAGTTDASGVTTVDERAVRNANEAIQSFQAQQAIDALRAQQATADALAEQAAKQQMADLDVRQKAADDKAKLDTENENKAATRRKTAFDTELADLERHLTATKGRHSNAIAQLDALWTTFGLTGKDHGKSYAINLAAGMDEEQKAVAKSAEALADVIRKYIKTSSPAEAGPLHDNPPDVMGANIGKQIAAGVASQRPAFDAAMGVYTQAAAGVGTDHGKNASPLAGSQADARVGAAGNPTGHYEHQGDSWLWVPAGGTTAQWNAPIAAPTVDYAYIAMASQPNYKMDTGTDRGAHLHDPRPGPTINVYNPAPEPAGRSITDRLKLRSAFGY